MSEPEVVLTAEEQERQRKMQAQEREWCECKRLFGRWPDEMDAEARRDREKWWLGYAMLPFMRDKGST